jgi:glycosyltransferase involved in cell wall biosynthesis
MKVLLISAYFPIKPDDPARSFVRDEACALSEIGVEVHVARWRYAGRFFHTKDSVVDEIHVHGLKLLSPKNLFIGFSNLWRLSISLFPVKELGRTGVFFSYGKQVERIIKRYSIDVIHAHFAYPDGFVGLMAKKGTGKPLVVTLHGFDILVEPTVKYGCRLNPEIDRAVRMVLKDADRVIAASSATYRVALELGCSPNKLVLIPNAVDVKRFSLNVNRFYVRAKFGLEENPMVFTLRAHEPQKGIEYLIRAVPLVLKKVPNAVFVVGGEGRLRAYHESLARELGVSGNIVFTGRIPQSELPYFYASCDVFVIPSIIEAFGLVTIEAMACGKPVVGTDVGGIPDIIEDGLNGFLVKPRDPDALAQKIILLLSDSKLREKTGKAGREMVEKKFNIEKRAERIIKVYSSFHE